MTRKAKPIRKRRSRPGRSTGPAGPDDAGKLLKPLEEVGGPPEAVLTGGDVDADWIRAGSSGEEAVGGSVATPDQDVVDEIGRALGVEQAPDAEVRTADELLRERDRFRWHLARKAEDEEEKQEGEEAKQEGHDGDPP